MTIVILDEDGIREIPEDKGNVMCENCFATNEGYRRKCKNCGKILHGMVIKNE